MNINDNMEPIQIEFDGRFFRVSQGGRHSDGLCFDSMLDLINSLTHWYRRDIAPTLMRTKEQWAEYNKAQEATMRSLYDDLAPLKISSQTTNDLKP